ncbi:hypothetical protein H2199_005221 [Coniosporium tulheliwenetii]|uniref:Uncharacterized protein n=1 Tax=Coniosporium tulheliwenetii TaxID=3383036 RepID=A0ACC2Z2W4_9PEZI|nr:hypothetical protein H2199_005221 [Cladosporium sp. JES 115]
MPPTLGAKADQQHDRLDILERRVSQLQIEINALESEQDDVSKARLREAKAEMANVDEELKPLREKDEAKKARPNDIHDASIKLDSLRTKLTDLERTGQYAEASDIKYYAIPATERRILQLEAEAKRKETRNADASDYMSSGDEGWAVRNGYRPISDDTSENDSTGPKGSQTIGEGKLI